VFGLSSPILINVPLLHNFVVTLSVNDDNTPLPPRGVFDWHYLQCVVKRFGTPSYKNFTDIAFCVLPFKTASEDSEEEYLDDDKIEPPYPSYRFDRYLEEQAKIRMTRERNREVLQWSSEIPSHFC
jgi:hypothetical protein